MILLQLLYSYIGNITVNEKVYTTLITFTYMIKLNRLPDKILYGL